MTPVRLTLLLRLTRKSEKCAFNPNISEEKMRVKRTVLGLNAKVEGLTCV